MIAWMHECVPLHNKQQQWMNKCMNDEIMDDEWMNEWWMDGWMNASINEYVNGHE